MVRPWVPIAGPALVLACLVFALTFAPAPAEAQFLGYGNMAFNDPGFGYGYGFPGYGGAYGYGVPGYGYGAGYPGLNYNYGYGYGFPGYYGASLSVPGIGFGGYNPYPFLGYGGTYPNPLFGLGLSPLGVESALAERYLLGRGLSPSGVRSTYSTYGTTSPYGYGSSYYPPGSLPR